MKINLTHLKTINDLAKTRSTGNPALLSRRLGISERSLNYIIRFMREELDAPIFYDRRKQSYYYLEEGSISFKFQKHKELVSHVMKVIQASIATVFLFSYAPTLEFVI